MPITCTLYKVEVVSFVMRSVLKLHERMQSPVLRIDYPNLLACMKEYLVVLYVGIIPVTHTCKNSISVNALAFLSLRKF